MILFLRYWQANAVSHYDSPAVKGGYEVTVDQKAAMDAKKIIGQELFHQRKRIRNVNSLLLADDSGIDVVSFHIENIHSGELIMFSKAIGEGYGEIRDCRHMSSLSDGGMR